MHLLTFYQQAGAALGAVAFFTSTARCFDVLSDPLMAQDGRTCARNQVARPHLQVSDGFSSRFGRRRPFILVGCVLYALCLVVSRRDSSRFELSEALCSPPKLSPETTGLWFGLFYILFFLTDTWGRCVGGLIFASGSPRSPTTPWGKRSPQIRTSGAWSSWWPRSFRPWA